MSPVLRKWIWKLWRLVIVVVVLCVWGFTGEFILTGGGEWGKGSTFGLGGELVIYALELAIIYILASYIGERFLKPKEFTTDQSLPASFWSWKMGSYPFFTLFLFLLPFLLIVGLLFF